MRRTIGSAVALVALVASSAFAQVKPAAKQAGGPGKAAAVTWGALTGDWEGKSMRGTSDSVITAMTVTFTLTKRAYVTFPGRPRIRARNLQVGGDSVVMDVGPYESVSRPGHKITTHTVARVANHKMTGTFYAKFDDGQTMTGRIEANHKLK